MLDPDRAKFVTASQSHLMMADWSRELNPEPRPDCYTPELEVIFKRNKPLVGDLKATGIELSGAQLNEAYKYWRSTRPVYTKGMESLAQLIAMKIIITDNGFELSSFGGNKQTERGNEYEAEAVTALQDHIGTVFDATGDDQAFLSDGNIGATPDGVEYDDFNIASTAEVKCPDDHVHMHNLVGHWLSGEVIPLTDAESLLKIYPEYYWQCQTALAVTGAAITHFATYNPKFGEHSLIYIPVKRNEDEIRLIKSRAKIVINRSNEIRTEIHKLQEAA